MRWGIGAEREMADKAWKRERTGAHHMYMAARTAGMSVAQMRGSMDHPLTKRMVPSMAAKPTPTPTMSTVLSRFSCDAKGRRSKGF